MAQMTPQNKRDTLHLWGVRLLVLTILDFKSYHLVSERPLQAGDTVLMWNDDALEWMVRQSYLNESVLTGRTLEHLTPTMLAGLPMDTLMDHLSIKFIDP